MSRYAAVSSQLVFNQIESSLISLKSKDEFTRTNIRIELTKYLLPEVNTQFFSNKVLNKNLRKVPTELKDEFVTELSIQLINTYSNLLSKYNNETIVINNGSLSKSGKIAMVNITIVGQKKSNKAVIKLLKSNDEGWKFFDIVIEGISLIDSKQAEINSSFNKLGPEATLKRLKEINNRGNPPS
jgi:phospholipid transport system substrate-binding protein